MVQGLAHWPQRGGPDLIALAAGMLAATFALALGRRLHAQLADTPLTDIPYANSGDTAPLARVATAANTVIDVTASDQPEPEARLMRAMLDDLPALMAFVDTDQKVVFASRRYAHAYAIAPEMLPGIQVRTLLGEDVYAQSQVFIGDALAGRAVNFERLVSHTGAVRWERVTYVPQLDNAARVIGILALVDDITELKRAQHTFAKSEMRLRTITDNMPALIAYIDREQRYRFCNGHHESILNLAPEKMLGQTVRQVMGEPGYASMEAHIQRALQGERVTFEQQVDQASGRYFLHDLIPETEIDGTVTGFYSMVQDITARKEAELRERASQKLLRSVTDNLPALVCYIDAEERFQFNNQPYEKWFGKPLAQITGQRVADLMSPSDFAIHQPYYTQARNGTMAEFEFEATQDGGQHFYHTTYLPQFDEQQQLNGVCGMINDITTLKRVEQQLRILARHDTLTGLPNRNQFDDKLADAMARSRRSGTPMALMFLDIDHFKSINDTLGHHGGDAVLREFAQRLIKAVRATDTVARLAGDEFVIILEGLHVAEECATVAKKIIAAMTRAFDVLGYARRVTTSVGIAIDRGDIADGEALLRRADDALYDAKAAGRNTFRVSE